MRMMTDFTFCCPVSSSGAGTFVASRGSSGLQYIMPYMLVEIVLFCRQETRVNSSQLKARACAEHPTASHQTHLTSHLLQTNSPCRTFKSTAVSCRMVYIAKSRIRLGGLCLEMELTLKGWRPRRAPAGLSAGTSACACSSSNHASVVCNSFHNPNSKAERSRIRCGVHAAKRANAKQRPASLSER